jgi:hypothetical protein
MATFEQLDRLYGKPAPISVSDPNAYWGNLLRSAGYSAVSLLGVEPPKDLIKFESENPKAAFVADMLGFAAPYSVALKGASKVPALTNLVNRVGSAKKLATSPIATGIAKNIAQFAPIEAARVAATPIIGPILSEALDTTYSGIGDVAASSALDLALTGVVGGVFQGFKAFGQKATKNNIKIPGIDPSIDILKDPQIAIRNALKAVDEKTIPLSSAEPGIFQAERAIRGGGVKNFIKDIGSEETSKSLNKLFKPQKNKNILTKRFYNSTKPTDYVTRDDWLAVARSVGLEDKWHYVQMPRVVTGRTQKGKDIITQKLQPLEIVETSKTGSWSIRKDQSDGLFVVAHKSNEAIPTWVIFKTDSPGQFLPSLARNAKLTETRMDVFGQIKPAAQLATVKNVQGVDIPNPAAGVHNTVVQTHKTIPIAELEGLNIPKGNIVKTTDFLLEKFGAKSLKGSDAFTGINRFVKDYLAPAQMQFGDNQLAAKIFAVARAGLDAADTMVNKLYLGKTVTAPTKSLIGKIGKSTTAVNEPSIRNFALNLSRNDPEQWIAYTKAIVAGADPKTAVKEYGLGTKAMKLYNLQNKADLLNIEGLNASLNAAGQTKIIPKPWHLGMSRLWVGDQRVQIFKGNKLFGYASGFNKATAQAEAERLVQVAKEAGLKKIRIGKTIRIGEFADELQLFKGINRTDAKDFGRLYERVRISTKKPSRVEKLRKGASGFQGEKELAAGKAAFTFKEYEEALLKQYGDYQRLASKTSTEAIVKSDLNKLMLEDPAAAQRVAKRLGMLYGEQGSFSKAINQAIDVPMGNLLGNNSASKIVATTNKWLFPWTLGFMNVGFAAANLLNSIQTGLPMLSMLTTAAPQRLSRAFTYYPVQGLKTTGSVGHLDILKIAKQSFKSMGNPDPLLSKHFERAAVEGVWSPKFVEAYVGKNSTTVKDLAATLKGEEPFSNWILAVADVLPKYTEEFARGHAFTMAHTLFSGIFKNVDDELIYQLSKEFVEKTQYQYATGDRARIITGPLGSAFGFFKNWQMHFLGWMSEYTGEAVLRGNWNPLLWQVGTTAVIGGAGAVPLADVASRMFTDKSLMANIYDGFSGGKDDTKLADTLFYGLPAFFEFSLQNQVAIPGADPAQDASRMFSFVYLDRMKYIQKTMGAAIDHWNATGENPVKSRRVRDTAMRAFAPKSIYQVTQALQDEGINSLSNGYPIVGEASVGERLGYSLSLNPIWIQSRYDVAHELWRDQDKMQTAITSAGKAWAEAVTSKDYRELNAIIYTAHYEGVDIGKVIQSAQAILSKGQEDIINRQFAPEALIEWAARGLQ